MIKGGGHNAVSGIQSCLHLKSWILMLSMDKVKKKKIIITPGFVQVSKFFFFDRGSS